MIISMLLMAALFTNHTYDKDRFCFVTPLMRLLLSLSILMDACHRKTRLPVSWKEESIYIMNIMEKAIYYTHLSAVALFIMLYLVKTVLLLINSREKLASFSSIAAVPERIIAFIFLASGIYLLTQLPKINTFMVIKLACVFTAIPLAIIGFQKGTKVLVLSAFILLIAAFGLVEASKKKSAIGDFNQASAMNGNEIFNTACAQCHGEDGKKGVMGAADLSVTPIDQQTLISTIKNGKGTMVGYEGMLSEAQIKAVAEYVQRLQKNSN